MDRSQLLHQETIDDGRAAKLVFSATRDDGKVATFETGSFLEYDGNDQPAKHDICVSTAGGCTRHCTFCAAPDPHPGFERLLSADEIVGQVDEAVARRNSDGRFRNVVGLMGNGEPTDNAAIFPALHTLFGRPYPLRRIMVSTIGENLRNVHRMAEEFPASAALPAPVVLHVSIHVADDGKRRHIIPGRRRIEEIMAAADRYSAVAYDPQHNRYPVRVNVVLMESVDDGFSNATPDDARHLVELMRTPFEGDETLRRQLKLSAYNPIPGKPFRAPPEAAQRAFLSVLSQAGLAMYTFQGSGIVIDSAAGTGGFACGQLRATTRTALRLSSRIP